MLEPTTPTGHATDEPQPPADTPPPGGKPVVVGTPEWDRLNERRGQLIYKKNRQGLTDEERAEFERLQEITRAAIAVAFPPPDWTKELAAIEKRLAEAGDSPKQ